MISIFIDFKLTAQSIDSIYLKGKEQFEIGNYVKALDYFNKTIQLQKKHKAVNYMAGMAEYNLKNYRSAKKYFKQETKNDSENINAFLFKAKSKENSGKYKSAFPNE